MKNNATTIEIPETSDLARIRSVLLDDASTMTRRQFLYGRQTARALKFIDVNSMLTEQGRQLLATQSGTDEEKFVLRTAIEESELVRLVLPGLLRGMAREDIALALQKHPMARLAKATADKRASALANWCSQLVTTNANQGNNAIPSLQTMSARLLIAHLSDIHISSETDPILARGDLLSAAIAARIEQSLASLCILAVTGDIAYSGTTEQYVLAEKLLTNLVEALRSRTGTPVYLVVAPGNHDCDFTKSLSARDTLVVSATPDNVDDAYAQICLETQANFAAFRTRIEVLSPAGRGGHALRKEYALSHGGASIAINCYNSAWDSTKHEKQGTLLMPPKPIGIVDTSADLLISMFHHPFNWMEANNAKWFKDLVESTSDIVLTGHEHVPGRFEKIHATGEHLNYLEGAALQESGEPDNGSFNVLLIDLGRKSQETTVMKWHPEVRCFEVAAQHGTTPFRRNQLSMRRQFAIQSEYENRVLNPEEPYRHPRLAMLRLSDVYIHPHLRAMAYGEGVGADDDLVRSPVAEARTRRHLIIYGQELTGKSSFARRLTADLHSSGMVAVLLDGSKLTSDTELATRRWVEDAYQEMYGANELERYRQMSRASKAFIVDDTGKGISPEAMSLVADRIERWADIVVLVANEEFQVALVSSLRHGTSKILAYRSYSIQQFGHMLRFELTEKWCFLGRTASEESASISRRAHQMEENLTRAIGKNLIPAYPALLLLCIQQLELAYSDQTASMGSFGHLYEALVTDHLSRGTGAGGQIDLDGKRRCLSHFANHLFSTDRRDCDAEDYERCVREYLDAYDVDYPIRPLLHQLDSSGLLSKHQGRVRFKYKYGFCFFFAEHLKTGLADGSTTSTAAALCEQLHHEESANIVLFLSHLARDTNVLVELLLDSVRQRSKVHASVELELRTLLLPLAASTEINALVLDDTSPEANRRLIREERDRMERSPNGVEPEPRDLPPSVLEYSASQRAVQILGQILRSFPGSLSSQAKTAMLHECYALGLRAAAALIENIVRGHDEIVDEIAHLVTGQRPELSKDATKLRQAVRQFIVFVCEALYYSAILNVSDSIGLPALRPSYAKIVAATDSIPYRLIDLAIKLDHFSSFPQEEVELLHQRLHKPSASRNVLTRLVWRHLYLFSAPYQRRQSLCQTFGIRQNAPLLASKHGVANRRPGVTKRKKGRSAR